MAPGDWARLIERIEEFDFSSLDFDVIGQMYERLISAGERRRFGQFLHVTGRCRPHQRLLRPAVSDDHVLDPACGGGTFLVRAYARKRALAQSAGGPPLSHGEAPRPDIRNRHRRVSSPAFPPSTWPSAT